MDAVPKSIAAAGINGSNGVFRNTRRGQEELPRWLAAARKPILAFSSNGAGLMMVFTLSCQVHGCLLANSLPASLHLANDGIDSIQGLMQIKSFANEVQIEISYGSLHESNKNVICLLAPLLNLMCSFLIVESSRNLEKIKVDFRPANI